MTNTVRCRPPHFLGLRPLQPRSTSHRLLHRLHHPPPSQPHTHTLFRCSKTRRYRHRTRPRRARHISRSFRPHHFLRLYQRPLLAHAKSRRRRMAERQHRTFEIRCELAHHSTRSATSRQRAPRQFNFLAVFGITVDPLTARVFISIAASNFGGIPSDPAGNLPDYIMSAAILDPGIRRPSTLTLEWSFSDPGTATLLNTSAESGISVYAEGLRSLFQPAMSRFNQLFVIDRGAYLSRVPLSTSCTTSRPFSRAIPGKVIPVRYGENYGHPNRQREGQCNSCPPCWSRQLLKPGSLAIHHRCSLMRKPSRVASSDLVLTA